MHPLEREFVVAVLRYQELRHLGAIDATCPVEMSELDEALLGVEPANSAPSDERRSHRRLPTRIPGSLRKHGISGPCTVVDLGAGGARVTNQAGLSLIVGDRVTVSLRPPESPLRIDFPAQVRHRDVSEDAVGLAFCGAPVVSYVRAGPTAPSSNDKKTRETPLARSRLRSGDIAA